MDNELPKQLHPDVVMRSLLRASLFLTAFQILKSEIVDRVKDFYLVGFDQAGPTYSSGYADSVLSLEKHRFEASCRWVVGKGALTGEDVNDIQSIRAMRNRVAHSLADLMLQPSFAVDSAILDRQREYVAKLGCFWGGIEASTDADLCGLDIDFDGIRSVNSVLLDYIMQVSERFAKMDPLR